MDISNPNWIENASRESDEPFMSFSENCFGAAYRRNLLTDRYEYVGPEIEELIGYTSEEMSAMSLDDLHEHVHPDDRQRTAERIEQVLRDGRGMLEYRFRSKDGEYRWLADSISMFADEEGPPLYYVGIVRDVTGRKRIEDTLQQQSERLEAAIAEARNEKSRLVAVMEALEKSRFRFELLSKTASLLLVSPDPEGSVNEICLEVMAHLGCQVFFNFLADEKTGRLRLNACSGIAEEEARKIEWLDYGVAVCGCVARDKTPIVANDILNSSDIRTELVKSYGVRAYACHPILNQGRLIGTISFGAKNRSFFSSDDITLMRTITDQVAVAVEQARLIKELRNSRDHLEDRVRERTAELEAKNQELQEFSYVASHDLQEPLRKIVTFGDILANSAGDSLDDESRDCINRMQKSAGMMRVLLDSLLRYSRVTTKPAPFEKTDLKESVKAALSNLEVTIKEKDALVEVCELPVIEVDPVQMIQLFQNIAANALKFCSEEYSPRVKIYSLPPEPDNGDEDKMHRICVEDNGIGFDERYLDKIFFPFQRLHGKIKYQGVGMGLAICKKIMDRHGGKITAKSAVDKGTTFIITLPERRQD